MMCYKDMAFCNATCELQGKCKASLVFAQEEKSKHPDKFIREDIGICVANRSYNCPDYKKVETHGK